MPRITIPDGKDPFAQLWGVLGSPTLKAAAHQLTEVIYHDSPFSLRELEVARVRIAYINDCNTCRSFRTARAIPERGDDLDAVNEEVYDHVLDPAWSGYSERERLAIEFAERYALAHLTFDDAFWDRLHAHFTDDELVDLAICVGWWIASGRPNRVFEVDEAGCQIPSEQLRQTVDRVRVGT